MQVVSGSGHVPDRNVSCLEDLEEQKDTIQNVLVVKNTIQQKYACEKLGGSKNKEIIIVVIKGK